MSPKEKLRQIQELQKHPGWALMKERMLQEIDMATRQLVRTAWPAEEAQRRQGAIWAGYQLLEVPERLHREFENEVMVEAAKLAAATAATKQEK